MIKLDDATKDTAGKKTVEQVVGRAVPAAAAPRASAPKEAPAAKKASASASGGIELGLGSKKARRGVVEPVKVKKLKEEEYLKIMDELHVELVKAQTWIRESGTKVLMIFEGRDASGKGGTIKRFIEHMNPRGFRIVALDKPTDRERTQWFFQRYLAHLPSAGEIVFFDRSWYNRSGVERVMGFCNEDQVREFLRVTPGIEQMLINGGIKLIKYYFLFSKQEQGRRFQSRMEDPLKQWKLSPVDKESQDRWDAYTAAEEDTFYYTSTKEAPWTIIRSDDKKHARINAIKFFLSQIDYPDKNKGVIEYDRRLVRTPQEEMNYE